ncbi:hypothetical protein REPUB_Repub12eG0143900 [Reevesia pubescens]
MAHFITSGWHLFESLHYSRCPKGETISKAIRAFIGDHIRGYVAENCAGGGGSNAAEYLNNVGAAWNKVRLRLCNGVGGLCKRRSWGYGV